MAENPTHCVASKPLDTNIAYFCSRTGASYSIEKSEVEIRKNSDANIVNN